jgi:hypothetical protein
VSRAAPGAIRLIAPINCGPSGCRPNENSLVDSERPAPSTRSPRKIQFPFSQRDKSEPDFGPAAAGFVSPPKIVKVLNAVFSFGRWIRLTEVRIFIQPGPPFGAGLVERGSCPSLCFEHAMNFLSILTF